MEKNGAITENTPRSGCCGGRCKPAKTASDDRTAADQLAAIEDDATTRAIRAAADASQKK